MQNTPYPFLSNLQGLSGGSSLGQLTSLFAVNQQYRHQSPHYFAEKPRNQIQSAAKQSLENFQQMLNRRANPYAFEGQQYQALPSSVSSGALGDLIAQISQRGHTASPYGSNNTPNYSAKGSGSRHVVVDINLLNGDRSSTKTGADVPNFLRSSSQKGQTFRLHYYQDSAQEVILLKDITARKSASAQPYRGQLHQYSQQQSTLGNSFPLPYASGAYATQTGYSAEQTTLLTRKVGEQRFQTLTAGDDTRQKAAEAANKAIEENFARFRKIKKIQDFTDKALQANSAFVIVPLRSTLDASKITKNNQNITDFYPGLRQGFTIRNQDSDVVTAGQLIGDHYRAKYSSHTTEVGGSLRHKSQQAGVNSELYQNYAGLVRARKNAHGLGTVLSSNTDRTRNHHLMQNGVLMFSSFDTTLSNDQASIDSAARFREDVFQSQDSLVSGQITLFNVKKSFAPKAGGEITQPEQTLGYSIVNNRSNSSLRSLMLLDGSVDIDKITRRAKDKLSGHSGKAYYDQTALSGNIDVSTAMLQGLRDASGLNASQTIVIDLSHLDSTGNRIIDINWQLGRS